MKSDDRFTLWRLLLVVLGATIAGCVSIAERVGSDLVARDLEAVEQEFKLFDSDLALFRGCLTERGGSCQSDGANPLPHSNQDGAGQAVPPVRHGAGDDLTDSVGKLQDDHPAKSALAVLNHPVLGQVTALHNHLRGHDTSGVDGFSVNRGNGAHGGPESTATMLMTVSHVHHFHRGLLSSLGTTAWESLHGHCASLLAAHGEAPGREALEADCRRVAFIRGYLEAYTRTGEFVEVEVQLAGATSERVGDRLAQDIQDEVQKADAALSNVFKVSSAGFVSRNHEFRAQLPTLKVTVDPTASRLLTVTDVNTGEVLDEGSDLRNLGVVSDESGVGTGTRIGAELVRVFLEAIFDAHEGLPAVAPANAPDLRPTGLTLGEYSLPLFTSPMGNVDSRDLSHMMHTNDQVAAKTRAIVSRIVGGVGPLSLNNPALQALITEIITTSVREATAKATWCWYACNLDVELKQLETGVRTAAGDEARQVEDRVKKAAEHVKLKLEMNR